MPGMTYYVEQTFFRPEEKERVPWTLPAPIYNQIRLALRDSELGNAFVSLRAMQFLAVIDNEEIIFVDGNGEYRVHNGEGGRVIKLAWQNFKPSERDTIESPVPCEIVYYTRDASEHCHRILGLIEKAIEEHREAKNPLPKSGAKIIPL